MLQRCLASLTLLLACALAPGCADKSLDGDDAADGTDGTDGADGTEGTQGDDSTDGDTDDGGPTLTEDEQLCLDRCVSGNELGCTPPWAGETCYTRCLDDLERAEQDGCPTEARDAMVCEATASDRSVGLCESEECLDEYKWHDLCRGRCSHLGGNQGSGGSQTQCFWSTTCPGYDHDFEVACSVGDGNSTCECLVDEEVIATCDHGAPLQAFWCGDDSMHVFTTCCRDAFEGVLFE